MTRYIAAILAAAVSFVLGMAFHEYLRPIARRVPTLLHINNGSAHDRAMAWSAGYSEGFDAASADPRTAELATGGGR
jgi:hypothetical protein